MSEHDDKQLNEELASLRTHYSSLSQEAPESAVDASIRAAADRQVRRHYKPAWVAAAGLAACVALAVILVPTLLIETPREAAPTSNADLVLIAKRHADEADVQRKQGEAIAMRATPATPPPAPQAAIEGKGEISLAHEEWLAREEVAPAKPEIDTLRADNAKLLAQRAPAGARTAAPVATEVDVLRAELANADEPTWRKKLLALREQGNEELAQQLLVDYRARFKQPDTFTLTDLEQMNNEH